MALLPLLRLIVAAVVVVDVVCVVDCCDDRLAPPPPPLSCWPMRQRFKSLGRIELLYG